MKVLTIDRVEALHSVRIPHHTAHVKREVCKFLRERKMLRDLARVAKDGASRPTIRVLQRENRRNLACWVGTLKIIVRWHRDTPSPLGLILPPKPESSRCWEQAKREDARQGVSGAVGLVLTLGVLVCVLLSGCAGVQAYNSHVAAREDSLSGFSKDEGNFGGQWTHRVEYR